jgi:hypothetical protein
MSVNCPAILAFIIVFTGSSNAFFHVVELPSGRIKSQFYESKEVVEIYFQAVARGELVVFDRKLDKSMLKPVRVEYVYELNSTIPRVKVYSELKEPIPIPDHRNCTLRGVSATLDANGRIIETEVHIWPE